MSKKMSSPKKDDDPLVTSLHRDLSEQERKLISTLDAHFLLEFLDPQSLESLLAIHSQVCSLHPNVFKDIGQQSKHSSKDFAFLCHEVTSSLSDEWVSEAQSLSHLLSNPHLQNVLMICSDIKKNEYYPGDHPHHEYYNVHRPNIGESSSKNPTQAGSSVSNLTPRHNPIYQSIDSHLPSYLNHHHYDILDGESYYYFRDEEEYNGRVSRMTGASNACKHNPLNVDGDPHYTVKVIEIVKGNEPLGITVKLLENSSEAVVVSRILYGGSAYRSGLISVGDIIFEVNGISLKGKTHREVVRLLERESHHEAISFKLLVSDDTLYFQWTHHRSNNNIVSRSELKESGIFVKAHFDYNPCLDSTHPCPDVGLLFKKGDILEIVNQEDDNWWQARHEDDIDYSSRAGIIPSTKLQEKRLAAERDVKRIEYLNKPVEIIPGFKSPIKKANWSHRVKKVMYRVNETEDFEDSDLATYEEVIHLFPTPGFCRPIVLFGSPLIGKNKLIRRLLHMDNHLYRTPVAHTTRPPREEELDGAEYFFSDKAWFSEQIKLGNFVEYEEYRGNFYGIHRETIRSIIVSGSVCLLSLHAIGLKNVRNSLFKPFVIFLKPETASLSFSHCSACKASPAHATSSSSAPVVPEKSPRVCNEYIECNQPNDQKQDMNQSQDLKLKVDMKEKVKGQQAKQIKRTLMKNLSDQQKYDLLVQSSRMQYLYGHYFDVILMISQDDLQEDVIKQLVQMIRAVQLVPQWAPASWL